MRGLVLTPKRTRPYTPRTNGKAERFIKTLLVEWAYSMPFNTSVERNHWLLLYLEICNSLNRPHTFQQFALMEASE